MTPDVVSQDTRSRMMAGIRSKNTKPEIQIRRALHRDGFRFRIHVRGVPGSPDIVLPKHKAVIFVHGCFWHAHTHCKYFKVPQNRPEFWTKKFETNRARDVRNLEALAASGWRAAVIWECATRNDLEGSVAQVEAWLTSQRLRLDVSWQ